MPENGPRYPREEFARRGDAIYNDHIRASIRSEDLGKYILIDIETAEYEIDFDELAASDRLYARVPTAQPWMRRIGYRAARHLGSRPLREELE